MFWPQVKAGDVVQQSATRENQIRKMLNGVSAISACDMPSTYFNNNIINVVNATDKEIPAYTAVCVSSIGVYENGKTKILVTPAKDDNVVWGITATKIMPNGNGSMIVSGTAQAFVSGGVGEYAVPGADGKLVASTSGNAKIWVKGDENTPSLIVLGGRANTPSTYRGAFAVRYLGERKFEIYDTAYPNITDNSNSKICGHTDLPGDAYYVARQIFTLPEDYSTATIYLVACYKDDKYSTLFSHQAQPANSGAFANVAVASVSASGEITQKLTSGTAVFGRDWFL